MPPRRLLFVCLGNICRSPMAADIFGLVAAEAGRGDSFQVDSAGTASWHAGKPPDARAVAAARRRGIDLSAQRARQVRAADFEEFDFIFAMDASNHAELLAMASDAHAHKIRLFLEATPEGGVGEVPDPYYGGDEGFEDVLDLIDTGARALLASLPDAP